MSSERPSWDKIWMEMAHILSKRSLDPRNQVGAVIVNDDNTQILALGYNGDHKGGPNVVDSYEPGESGFIHAEENALIKCDYTDARRKIMYVTLSPCRMCSKRLLNARISEVVYDEVYRDTSGLDLLAQYGVITRKFKPT